MFNRVSFKELDDAKIRLEEFQNLAKKIVQVDILFQKYASKENECNLIRTELSASKKLMIFLANTKIKMEFLISVSD